MNNELWMPTDVEFHSLRVELDMVDVHAHADRTERYVPTKFIAAADVVVTEDGVGDKVWKHIEVARKSPEDALAALWEEARAVRKK